MGTRHRAAIFVSKAVSSGGARRGRQEVRHFCRFNSLRLTNRFAFHLAVIAGVDLVTAAIAWIFYVGEA
jgi:hypothetical protein